VHACSDGQTAFTNFQPTQQHAAVEECKAACCGDSQCDAWVVRNVTEANTPLLRNCTHGKLCCWKKTCGGLPCGKTPRSGCVSGVVSRPVPISTNLNAYAVGLRMTGPVSAELTVERWSAEAGGAQQTRTVLATYNASAPLMECGVVAGSWNILRVVLEGSRIRVWLNTMWTDTQGPATARKGGTPVTARPRLDVTDDGPALPAGGISIVTQGSGTNVDYLGVLPVGVL
jgi:hypothetical protein